MVKVNEISAKEIMTKSKLPDADFVCNPYVGCPHKCIYCYAEYMKRFTKHTEEWGEFLDVKNVDVIRLPKFQDNQTVLISSVTDPYNSFEFKYEKTRQILNELVGKNVDVEILTKSSLVLRDIELLKKMPNIKVGISMNTMDDKFRKDIEPYASSIGKRLETLKRLHYEGIHTYVFVSPIFPELSNTTEIIQEVGEYADYVCFENLNLRGGYKKKIMEYISEQHTNLLPLYKQIYYDNNYTYWEETEKKIETFCKQLNVEYKIYFYHEKIKKK